MVLPKWLLVRYMHTHIVNKFLRYTWHGYFSDVLINTIGVWWFMKLVLKCCSCLRWVLIATKIKSSNNVILLKTAISLLLPTFLRWIKWTSYTHDITLEISSILQWRQMIWNNCIWKYLISQNNEYYLLSDILLQLMTLDVLSSFTWFKTYHLNYGANYILAMISCKLINQNELRLTDWIWVGLHSTLV